MPSKKDNLPTNVDVDLENGGTIKYANEVIAIIAGVAASEVDGIAGMCTSGGISDIIGRNRSITRGVKVEVGSEEASVDLYIVVEYGSPIQKVASEVQENVRKAIETMTGLHVVNVDVHVQGVSFEREKKALATGLESAHLTSEETGRIQAPSQQGLSEPEEAAQQPNEASEAPGAPGEERLPEEKAEEAPAQQEKPASEPRKAAKKPKEKKEDALEEVLRELDAQSEKKPAPRKKKGTAPKAE